MYKASISVGGTEVIRSIAAEWTELCGEGPGRSPFSTPEWFISFIENFKTDILLLIVRHDSNLRAVLPLVCRRTKVHGLPITVVQSLHNLNTPRFDLIHGAADAERGPVIEAIWHELRGLAAWNAIEFRLVDEQSWLADLSRRAAGDGYQTGVWSMDAAPYITLPDQSNDMSEKMDFFKGQRKHFAGELDRRQRRLVEVGSIEFTVNKDYSAGLIDRYLDLELQGGSGGAGPAASQDAHAAGLHHDYARAAGERGCLLVYELRLDGTTIAMSLNIRAGSTVYHWRTSYDEAYSKFSPGNLLFRNLFRDCVEMGVSEIDFLSPATPNKLTWSTAVRPHAAFYIFRPGFVGGLAWVWKFFVIKHLRMFKGRHAALLGKLGL